MSFGERLKEARTLRDLTQKQLAEKLNLGNTTVTGYEKDSSEPNMNTISKIMDILEVDANYLFQDEAKKLYMNETSAEEFENIIKNTVSWMIPEKTLILKAPTTIYSSSARINRKGSNMKPAKKPSVTITSFCLKLNSAALKLDSSVLTNSIPSFCRINATTT